MNLELFARSMLLAVASVFGLILGSFFTALASRIVYYFYGSARKQGHLWKNILTKPSFCFSCGQELEASALIPIVSFLFQGGHCRHCGANISLWTFAGELFIGLLLPYLIWAGKSFPAALFFAFACGALYTSIATDYKYYILDYENTSIVALFLAFALLLQYSFEWAALGGFLAAGAGAFAVLAMLHFLGKGQSLGFGDVLLGGVLAFGLGLPFALLFFQLAALLAIAFHFAVRQKRKKRHIPFGSCLAIAFYCVLILQTGTPDWMENTIFRLFRDFR